MSLDRAFYLSSILLAGAAFGSLALTADVPIWLLALGSSAYVLCLAQIVAGTQQQPWLAAVRLSPVTWNIILLTAFAAFWIDLLWISQELLSAGIRFLIVLMVNKLFNLQQRRDFLHLYAISLMAVLASASLTTQVWYAPVFLAYLFAGIWTLLLYHLTKEREDAATETSHHFRDTGQDVGQITSRFFWTTNGMAVGAVCLTLSIFFIIPRVGIGLLQKNRGESLRTTGFSEKVDLGVMGSIKQDPSIVMRVELPDSETPSGSFYLRGMAYDHYNGRSWSAHLSVRRPLNEKPQGTFTIRTGGSHPSKKWSPEIRRASSSSLSTHRFSSVHRARHPLLEISSGCSLIRWALSPPLSRFEPHGIHDSFEVRPPRLPGTISRRITLSGVYPAALPPTPASEPTSRGTDSQCRAGGSYPVRDGRPDTTPSPDDVSL